jgi:hypothetical protein
MLSLLINNEKIKYPEKVADAFSSFFLSVAENLNLCRRWGGGQSNLFFKTSISLQISWY